MKLENQVCSLEQAKRLKELGVSLNDVLCAFRFISSGWKLFICEEGQGYDIAAFTVAELGVMLQDANNDWLGTLGHPILGYQSSYIKEVEMFGDEKSTCTFPHEMEPNFEGNKTEAQARASMLIYLLENKLTTPEEVNTRLQQ